MPLTDCPDCGNSISTEAYACPKCGRPTGRKHALGPTLLRTFLTWIVLVIVFLTVWHFLRPGH
jgi:hypothetical protein